MEMLVELNAGTSSSFAAPPVDEAPALGPGGLKNMSAVSRKAARSGRPGPPPVERRAKVEAAPPERVEKAEERAEKAGPLEAEPPAAEKAEKAEPEKAAPEAPRAEVVPRRCSRNERRAFGLGATAVHSVACLALGGSPAVVAACGCCAVAYASRWHDDEARLRRRRDALALRLEARHLEEARRVFVERCPSAVKKLALGLLAWRLAGLLAGPAAAAAYLRAALVALLVLAACFAYLPLHDANRRGAALARVLGFAFVAWNALFALDAAFGPDASAALASAAFLARPDLDTLDLKRRKLKDYSRHDVHPDLRARDLGLALVVADLHLYNGHDRANGNKLYLGLFGSWFVATRQPSSTFETAHPRFERLD